MYKHIFGDYIALLFVLLHISYCNTLLAAPITFVGLIDDFSNDNTENVHYNNSRHNIIIGTSSTPPLLGESGPISAKGYLDKLDNLERSVAAVLIKVAYGTTSTTKRSIPDNIFVSGLTTIATPLLTTQRYLDKTSHQQQINLHHRNYELDLERDHALPTSAPNADILKSNSNPTYPNPNRHHNHDRERHRHVLNSTPIPSLPNILKKNVGYTPTIPMHTGDIPSYSPPARSFFTPPLPPEYQNPFADKPTLRGTNNEGIIVNTGTFINRRPIPPPSLMPGHERIPFRPPDLSALGGSELPAVSLESMGPPSPLDDIERKKVLNTPSRGNKTDQLLTNENNDNHQKIYDNPDGMQITRKEVLPNIRRILSGSNGNKGEVPEVLLKQVTSKPILSYHQPPSSPVVLVEETSQDQKKDESTIGSSANINKIKNTMAESVNRNFETAGTENESSQSKVKMSTKSIKGKSQETYYVTNDISSTPSAAAAIGDAGQISTSSSTSAFNPPMLSSPPSSSSSSTPGYATWTIAWNIHVYLSVILFTILLVYSFYKMFTYNKLTHLFSQSYFLCIHIILIAICSSRIFYLCYDAYNIHSSFHIFISEILLHLPATFLTISFSVLILFLFLKSLNHKNNRYSSLIRPLTVIVGCGVHVVLCITLHYVESYTMRNHQQQVYYQQQQLYRRQQHQLQQYQNYHNQVQQKGTSNTIDGIGAPFYLTGATSSLASTPPRVLSLICQIIYIFVCLSLGSLYLYLYRILKRILRSKSQNYIHGYQNLSYAIHISIATALLFVLLAALQIFGAISISAIRPLNTHISSEVDWLQWGYQFSLRLIEVAIITLISWVTGLKTTGSSGVNVMGTIESRLEPITGGGGGINNREKNGHHQQNHTNVAGFFLPCTSTSSQEQFETDYPAVCNANTNLHTYTMRTGKLIYDDSLALNSLNGPASKLGNNGRSTDLQLQQPTYQHPYDNSSLNSSGNRNMEFSIQSKSHHEDHQQYADYLTDATTDHYENPNFDLRRSGSVSNKIQKFTKTSTTSTTASSSACSGSGLSVASQQQILLLQGESCYAEPLEQNCVSSSSYDFSNFERPKFSNRCENPQSSHGSWSEQNILPLKKEKKSCVVLERANYENSERRGSNSTQCCASSGGGGRYVCYNSFDRDHNSIRKSGTFNNILSNDGPLNRRNTLIPVPPNVLYASQRGITGAQTYIPADRQQQYQFSSQRCGRGTVRIPYGNNGKQKESDVTFCRATLERTSNQSLQQQSTSDDDMMLSGSNVEHTNLIHNEDGCCITNNSSTTSSGNITDRDVCFNSTPSEHMKLKSHQPSNELHSNLHNSHLTRSTQQSLGQGPSTSSNLVGSSSSAPVNISTDSMLVAELGFVRFRPLDDINNAQGVGIHNASIRNQNRVNVITQNSILDSVGSDSNSNSSSKAQLQLHQNIVA